MGMIQHKAILVTSWDAKKLKAAHKKAMKFFDPDNVTLITGAGMNGYQTFVVVPCGSKLGWGESQEHHAGAERFIEYLDEQKYEDGSTCLSYVEVNYGEFGLQAQDNDNNSVDSNERQEVG